MTAPRPVTPLSILASTLAELTVALGDAPADVRVRLAHALELARGLDPYLEQCTTPESSALQAISEATHARTWAADGPLEQEMLSGHVEGQTLKMLVALTGARRVLDVGMFTGYSALAMAEALEVGGEVVACEIDADVAALARRLLDASPHGSAVRIVVGPARETLQHLAADGDRFDVVFLDADKPGYLGYFRQVVDDGLVGPGGVILADNTLLQGHAYGAGGSTENGDAIAAFNRAVADDPRVEQVLIPVRDGLSVIRRV